MRGRADGCTASKRFVPTGHGNGKRSIQNVEAVSIVARPDGRVVVDVHQVVRALDGNVVADGRVLHVYRIVDGLVTNMEVEEHTT